MLAGRSFTFCAVGFIVVLIPGLPSGPPVTFSPGEACGTATHSNPCYGGVLEYGGHCPLTEAEVLYSGSSPFSPLFSLVLCFLFSSLPSSPLFFCLCLSLFASLSLSFSLSGLMIKSRASHRLSNHCTTLSPALAPRLLFKRIRSKSA